MRLLFLIFLCLPSFCFATDYYVSNTGDDLADGLTAGTAWETITKVNTVSFAPGDNIYFNKGDSWTGKIIPLTSGTSGNPITFSSYGSGDKPVLTVPNASILASEWTQLGTSATYYCDIPNPEWAGQVFEGSVGHDTKLTCKRVVQRIAPRNNGDFRRNDGSIFSGWKSYPGTGTIIPDPNYWVASLHETNHFSCKITQVSGETVILKHVSLAKDTTYFLSYASRSIGGIGGVQIKFIDESIYYYLTDSGGAIVGWNTIADKQTGIDNPSWAATSTDNNWCRKEIIFTTPLYFEKIYKIRFGCKSGTIWIDDVFLYSIADLTPGSFSTACYPAGNVGTRTYDVRLFVRLSDDTAPQDNEIIYHSDMDVFKLDDLEYITIDGFEIWGAVTSEINGGATYAGLTVTNCLFYYAGGGQQGQNGKFGAQSSKWIGAVNFVAWEDDTWFNDITITDNEIYGSLGLGIRGRRWTSGLVERNIIKNFSYGNLPWPGGIYLTQCDNTDIRYCILQTSGDSGFDLSLGAHGFRVNGIWCDEDSVGNTVEYNWIENVSGSSLYAESSDDGLWQYNVAIDAWCCLTLGGGREAHGNKIYNNTLIGSRASENPNTRVQSGYGISLTLQDPDETTIIKNNLIMPYNGFYIEKKNAFEGSVVSDNNFFCNKYLDSNIPFTLERWRCGTTNYTFAQWKALFSVDANSIEGLSSINPATGLHVSQPIMPSINNGANLGVAYDDALDPLSVWPDSVVTADQDSWGAGWEIGAYVWKGATGCCGTVFNP